MTENTSRLSTALADRYQIERRLGEGGMATVYLAEDLKHKRKVAVKVLRPELAAVIGGERFVQEITTTANLQHPHILPLFDSGEAHGFLYYVMPFIDGETLRDKLNRETQLGVTEAVKIAREVADALDYAHRQGIIHRDIKPENILLHDGRPMVADFGIALALSAAAGGRMTETGLSLGTPHYMSPEQATAEKDITNRSDIYSIGSVLYEMLTGSPPHVGATAQQIIMKIVTDEARPITELRKSVPPHVAAATAKSLEKLPADRFESGAEFAEALAKPGLVATTEYQTARSGPGRTHGSTGDKWRGFAMPAVLLGLAVLAAWGWLRPAPTAGVSRFDINVAGGNGPDAIGNGASLAIAPDGSRFVYVASDGALYERHLDNLESRPLPARGYAPFYSPDGEWIAFAEANQLKKVAPAGGPPLTVASIGNDVFRGGSWGEDGTIVFAPDVVSPLLAVPDGGGPIDTLTRLDSLGGIISHRWPEWLPGQRGILFQACRGSADECDIAVLDLRSDSIRYLFPGTSPHYIETGHVLYTSARGALLAVPFDLDRMELTGNPISLLEGVVVRDSWNGDFEVAANGTLLYLAGEGGHGNLSVIDSTGRARPLVQGLIDAQSPRFSPDGRSIAFTANLEGTSALWIFDRVLETYSRLTFETGALYPVWTAGGDTLYYSTDANSTDRDLWKIPADGSGIPEHVLDRPGQQYEIALPSPGDVALIREIGTSGGDLYSLPLNPVGEPTPWVVTDFSERSPSLSPDARWAAYVSDESGQNEIYVRAFPDAAGRWQVSAGGGTEPLWSHDGRSIYYRHSDTLFVTGVQTRPTFSVGTRRMVFTARFNQIANHTNYDHDRNTSEFAVISNSEDNATSLVVVFNWFEEVRQRMGGGR